MKETLSSYLDADWNRLGVLSEKNQIKRKWTSFFSPRFTPVALIRLAYFSNKKGYPLIGKIFSLLNFLIFKIEVPQQLGIGPGLVIPHPQGTVLGAREIGKNVTIFHQVTLGAKDADFSYDLALRPKVGDGVTLCVGAKILGSLTLHDNCTVGANAVVLSDVPANAVAVGVPAKLLIETGDQSE